MNQYILNLEFTLNLEKISSWVAFRIFFLVLIVINLFNTNYVGLVLPQYLFFSSIILLSIMFFYNKNKYLAFKIPQADVFVDCDFENIFNLHIKSYNSKYATWLKGAAIKAFLLFLFFIFIFSLDVDFKKENFMIQEFLGIFFLSLSCALISFGKPPSKLNF